MEYIKLFFLVWGSIVGLGTLVGLYKSRNNWDMGVTISGGVTVLYAVLTILSALDILYRVPNWWAWTGAPIGLTILFLSQVLSLWAASELKRNFSPKITPVAEGKLITTGPFQICRHPIMLAMLMSWVGTGIALGSIPIFIGYGFAAILIMRRLALEEKYLEDSYGKEFLAYKQQVSAIVPCLPPSSLASKELGNAIVLLSE